MRKNVRRWGQAATAMLGFYLVACGPLQSAGGWLANESGSQEAVAQEVSENSSAVEFETCAAVADWQRPNAEEQSKHLEKDARYAMAIEDDSSKAASSQFWDRQVVSFTTYGLSARMEPVNLTGLWTVDAEMQNCYTPETTQAINEGDRAEAWLLNHRIKSLVWEGDRYVMTVEPTATGMQVVQFERDEQMAALPLEVVTTDGKAIAVTSGDWQ